MGKQLNNILKKIHIFIDSLIGECIKMYLRIIMGQRAIDGIYKGETRGEKVIISLTSYGRRVRSVLPFTIYSLLNQTMKPDMVLLWLDNENWNNNNIPQRLQKLREFGLTIRFCGDIKSYKKHIPTLEAYPNDIIITVDDDLYYSTDFIERLICAYKADPNHIYTHRAHRPLFDINNHLKPYNNWEMDIHGTDKSPVFATTGGGCLMKRSFLHKDATREDLFTSLCPTADDVWFYFMSVMQGTKTIVLPYRSNTIIPLDNFFQLTHKNSNLSSKNCKESQNDTQINNMMRYYDIRPKDLVLQ